MTDIEKPKSNRGGYRRGAGRKKGKLLDESKLQQVKSKLTKLTPELLDILWRKAKGEFDNGKPDFSAAKLLWESAVGKATERQELTGANGSPLLPEHGMTEEERQQRLLALIQTAMTRVPETKDKEKEESGANHDIGVIDLTQQLSDGTNG